MTHGKEGWENGKVWEDGVSLEGVPLVMGGEFVAEVARKGGGKLGMEASSLPCRRIEKGGKPLLSASSSIPLFRFQNLANHKGWRLDFVCGPLIIEAVDLAVKGNWRGEAGGGGLFGWELGGIIFEELVGLILLCDWPHCDKCKHDIKELDKVAVRIQKERGFSVR